jgi:rRNA-processing protein FCF1
MKLTIEKLTEWGACKEGKDWFISQDKTDGIKVVKKLIDVKIDWANWLVVRLMTHSQQVQYAIFAAEQVLDIFEKEYPDDKRPRKAIEAAKAYLKNPTEKNKNAAADAAADAAAYAAYAAAYAAADVEMKKRIINYGIKLFNHKEK